MPYLLLTLSALFWSGNFVLSRGMHAEITPVSLAFWRWILIAKGDMKTLQQLTFNQGDLLVLAAALVWAFYSANLTVPSRQ